MPSSAYWRLATADFPLRFANLKTSATPQKKGSPLASLFLIEFIKLLFNHDALCRDKAIVSFEL
jgi:hypothetical protein